MTQNPNILLVREYLQALADGEAGESLGRFFTEDAIQIELPNKLNPAGGRSDLATMKKRSEEGKHILKQQSYTVKSAVGDGDQVAVEAEWVGVLAIPLGSLPVGYEMKAHFAMFFEFNNGRIAVQRNYDCFEPW
ncbi:MAG: nuclear transport factor 2 family protein [Anaerolineaceae bacterium]|nr:nuclear transport factor 2 family protein [Anaerolineaceae bacterium]